MEDILLVRTFTIIGGLLVITTIFSKINKAYETSAEAWITIIGGFLFFLGLFIFVVFREISKAPLLASGDPFAEESKGFKYYYYD